MPGSSGRRRAAVLENGALMSVSRFYLIAVGVLLIGYAVFNKGFAYVGVAPLFIGEVFLGFSFFLVLAGSYSRRIFGSPLMWMIIVFITWVSGSG